MENQQTNRVSHLYELAAKLGRLGAMRLLEAQKGFLEHLQKTLTDPALVAMVPPENPWQSWSSYVTDAWQRGVLFLDILRERGNIYIEHVKEGSPPFWPSSGRSSWTAGPSTAPSTTPWSGSSPRKA